MLSILKKVNVDLLWAVGLVAMYPLLAAHCTHLWERPHFQFFPIAWGAFAFLVYSRAKIDWTTSQFRTVLGVLVTIVALISYGVAVWYISPWMACAAAFLLVSGWGLIRLGPVAWTRVLAWTALLWVTLPLPMNLDTRLVNELQAASSVSASAFLDVIGTPHLRLGNTIEIRNQKLFVDEACSGVDSLYSLFAVALLMITWQKRAFLVGLLTLISVPAWAWLGNLTRLVLIAYMLDTFDVDLSHGWHHTALGLGVFVFSFGCLYFTLEGLASLLNRFPSAIKPREARGLYQFYNRVVCWPGKAPKMAEDIDKYFSASRSRGKPVDSGSEHAVSSASKAPIWSVDKLRLATAVCALAFCAMGGVSWYQLSRVTSLTMHPKYAAADLRSVLRVERLPEKISEAVRSDFRTEQRPSNSFEGQHSAIWHYKHSLGDILFSVDFPFRGFHELWICYQTSGHELAEPLKIIMTPSPWNVTASTAKLDWPVYQAVFTNDLGEYTYLWFSLFDGEANPVVNKNIEEMPIQGIEERLARFVGAITYQCQMLVESGGELTDDDQKALLSIYLAGAANAIEQVKELDASIKKM